MFEQNNHLSILLQKQMKIKIMNGLSVHHFEKAFYA